MAEDEVNHDKLWKQLDNVPICYWVLEIIRNIQFQNFNKINETINRNKFTTTSQSLCFGNVEVRKRITDH